MAYDYQQKKIVAVLASNLETGIAFNVLGHLSVSIGAYADEDLMGRKKLFDASGSKHIGIAKYPFIITKVKPGRLRKLIHDSKEIKDLLIVDYPKQMLMTGHDDDLADSIAGTKEEDIEYLGAIIYGERDKVNDLTGNFSLWK